MNKNDLVKQQTRIEELEAKLVKVMAELKVLVDISTFMQSSAYYDKRRYQSVITDTVWSQWSKQLKFAKSTLAESYGRTELSSRC